MDDKDADVVMADQAHTVHYATNIPIISLPASDPPEVVAAAAKRYGAKYLIITESFGRYPEALREVGSDAFTLVYSLTATGSSPGLEVYKVKGSD